MGPRSEYFRDSSADLPAGLFPSPGGQTEHFRGGHYGTSAQIHRETLDWRHMAMVCDVTAKTLTCYIDYYQAKTIPLPGEMKWDAGPFYIGGGPPSRASRANRRGAAHARRRCAPAILARPARSADRRQL